MSFRVPPALALGLATAIGFGLIGPVALADVQPTMQGALTNLQQAKELLEKAEHDKGGYREKALRAVDNAIREVQEGMQYANTHPATTPRPPQQ
jgi:hypothetical protein